MCCSFVSFHGKLGPDDALQERERADAELKASHKRFENLTRGPRAQSLLARAAAALSLPDDSPAASSR